MSQPQQRPTRLPRPISTAQLSRATSSLTLNSTPRPNVPPQRPETGRSTLPIPKSRLPSTSKSTATLRPAASSSRIALRPSRAQLTSAPTPAETSRLRPAVRSVPSTNFKENFFAPPPGQRPSIGGTDRHVGLAKKKSQLSLQVPLGGRRTVFSTTGTSRLSNGSPVTNRLTGLKLVPGASPLPARLEGVPHLEHNSSTKNTSALPTIPPPSPSTQPILRQQRSHISAIPSHLVSSPWKGPRTSVEQIKDTEFSFTEEDSTDLSSGSRSSKDSNPQSRASGRGISALRPPTANGPARSLSIPTGGGRAENTDLALDRAIKEKEREIEMLRLELSVERQMLGRVGWEAAEKVEEARRGFEADKISWVGQVGGMKQRVVRNKYNAVEQSALELLKDIEAHKEVIKQLKNML